MEPFKRHPFLKYSVFSFLDSADLFNKIALLSTAVRTQLPTSGLVNQQKILKVNKLPKDLSNLQYALKLVTSLQVIVTPQTTDQCNTLCSILVLWNIFAPRKVMLDLVCRNLDEKAFLRLDRRLGTSELVVRMLTMESIAPDQYPEFSLEDRPGILGFRHLNQKFAQTEEPEEFSWRNQHIVY